MATDKSRTLSSLMFVLAFAALFALAGCSGQSSASSSASDADASESGAAAQEVALSDDLADVAAVSKDLAASVDASKAEDLSALPAYEDADAVKVEASEIEAGLEDASKAPAGRTLLTTGGIQMQVPSSWRYSATSDGWSLASRDGSVGGEMVSASVASVPSADVEAMAGSIPQALRSSGFDDVEIISFDNEYSASGTLCGSCICCAAKKGSLTYICYYEYVHSKNFVNMVLFYGLADDFKAYVSDIDAMTSTVAFNDGEAI